MLCRRVVWVLYTLWLFAGSFSPNPKSAHRRLPGVLLWDRRQKQEPESSLRSVSSTTNTSDYVRILNHLARIEDTTGLLDRILTKVPQLTPTPQEYVFLLIALGRHAASSSSVISLQEDLWRGLEDNFPKYVSLRNRVQLLRATEHLTTIHQSSLYRTICANLTKGHVLAKLTPQDCLSLIKLHDTPDLTRLALRRLLRTRRAAPNFVLLAALVQLTTRQHADRRATQTAYTLARDIMTEPNRTRALTGHDVATVAWSGQRLFRDLPGTNALAVGLGDCAMRHTQYTSRAIATILETLECWRVDRPEVARHLGHCWTDESSPRETNRIVRCAALQYSWNSTVMEPYLKRLRGLLLTPDFLVACSEEELSNFAWVLGFKTGAFADLELMQVLGQRLLDPKIVQGSSPKQACRIIIAFSVLASFSETQQYTQLVFQMMENYGEHLLSAELSALDCTCALYSYARSMYVNDMGIFDHLTDCLIAQLDKCTPSQVAQSLWACGKMVVWEDQLEEDEPYLSPCIENAAQMALHLVDRAEQLSTRDITQALWALAQLQLADPELIVVPLVERAKELATKFTPREVANVVWAVSKLSRGLNDFSLVYVLTRQYATDDYDGSDGLKSIEASSILYSLAKMNIRDEAVFRSLTAILVAKIDDATAQSIANVLWAHRAVHIAPPRLLLDTWTKQRLGVVALSDPKLDASIFL